MTSNPWESALRELVAASHAFQNEMPRHRFRRQIIPASPGWAASVKRLGMAWERARGLCHGDP